jgi:hypothetical protein
MLKMCENGMRVEEVKDVESFVSFPLIKALQVSTRDIINYHDSTRKPQLLKISSCPLSDVLKNNKKKNLRIHSHIRSGKNSFSFSV